MSNSDIPNNPNASFLFHPELLDALNPGGIVDSILDRFQASGGQTSNANITQKH